MASIKMGSFLLTRLSRGATHFDYTDCPYNCDFYSRASREARRCQTVFSACGSRNFYSRASREARLNCSNGITYFLDFYSRASREARLKPVSQCRPVYPISTHAPLARRDENVKIFCRRFRLFLLTRLSRGATDIIKRRNSG